MKTTFQSAKIILFRLPKCICYWLSSCKVFGTFSPRRPSSVAPLFLIVIVAGIAPLAPFSYCADVLLNSLAYALNVLVDGRTFFAAVFPPFIRRGFLRQKKRFSWVQPQFFMKQLKKYSFTTKCRPFVDRSQSLLCSFVFPAQLSNFFDKGFRASYQWCLKIGSQVWGQKPNPWRAAFIIFFLSLLVFSFNIGTASSLENPGFTVAGALGTIQVWFAKTFSFIHHAATPGLLSIIISCILAFVALWKKETLKQEVTFLLWQIDICGMLAFPDTSCLESAINKAQGDLRAINEELLKLGKSMPELRLRVLAHVSKNRVQTFWRCLASVVKKGDSPAVIEAKRQVLLTWLFPGLAELENSTARYQSLLLRRAPLLRKADFISNFFRIPAEPALLERPLERLGVDFSYSRAAEGSPLTDSESAVMDSALVYQRSSAGQYDLSEDPYAETDASASFNYLLDFPSDETILAEAFEPREPTPDFFPPFQSPESAATSVNSGNDSLTAENFWAQPQVGFDSFVSPGLPAGTAAAPVNSGNASLTAENFRAQPQVGFDSSVSHGLPAGTAQPRLLSGSSAKGSLDPVEAQPVLSFFSSENLAFLNDMFLVTMVF